MEHPEEHMGGQPVAFNQIMDRTVGLPPKAPEDLAAEAPHMVIFLAPGMPLPAALQPRTALGEGVVDVSAMPDLGPVMADSSVLGTLPDKADAQEPPGSPGGDVDDLPARPRRYMGLAYHALAECRDQFVLVESRRGTGKTYAILCILAKRAIEHPKSRYLIVRSSRTRLTDSAIATFVDQVLPAFGWPIPTCSREQISTYTCPSGSQFIFQGLDDPNRQQSVECAGVYVVEGVEIPSLDTITALAASMRQSCTPPMECFQCIVDCNPGAPGHPLNQVAEPVDDSYRTADTREQYERGLERNRQPAAAGMWKRIITHYADNPGYFDTVRWVWTTAGAQYLETLKWLTGHLKKRWYYGLWSAAQGSVFGDVFDEAVHVVDDFEPPADWPEYDGWDPGIDHVTGIPFTTVAPTGDIFVFDEVYEGGKSIAEHVATNVKPRLKGRNVQWFGDPHHFFSSTAQSPESCAEQAQKAGLSGALPWADLRGPAKQAAVNAFLQLLQNTVVYVKTGRRVGVCLYFMRKCKNAIMECQTWSYKRNAKGEQLSGDDAYEDKNNHLVGDPLVGMVATGQLVWRETGHQGGISCDNG